MKSKVLAGAILLGLFAVQSTRAELAAPIEVTEQQLIENAIGQAKLAMDATTMTRAKVLLRRASNCLIGRDSGYFIVGAGGPCNSRINVTTSATNPQVREQVTNAFSMLLAAGGQSDLQRAQEFAEDAIALLEEAQVAED